MDKITEHQLKQFSEQNSLDSLTESKQFEHFCTYAVIKSQHSETFDTLDFVVGDDGNQSKGSDTGIDGIGIIVNGKLLTDFEEFDEYAGVPAT